MGWLEILLLALTLPGNPDVSGAWRTPRISLAGGGYACLAEDVVVVLDTPKERELSGEYWARVSCSYLGLTLYAEPRNGILAGEIRPDGTIEIIVEGGPSYVGRVEGRQLTARGGWEVSGVRLQGELRAIRPAEYRGPADATVTDEAEPNGVKKGASPPRPGPTRR